MTDRALIGLASHAENVAAGLHAFRARLPGSATRITAIVSALFAVSSLLRELDAAHGDPRFEPSCYRIRDDLRRVCPSLQGTLDAALDMFARTRDRSYQMAWDDLQHRMELDEGLGFLERLESYQEFLRGLRNVLVGYPPPSAGLRELRRHLAVLADAQEIGRLRAHRRSIDASASTPRPRRPTFNRSETPVSPIGMAGDWGPRPFFPAAPEAPPPLSPTFTSSSSQTMSSSQTSYSNDSHSATSQLVHWAQHVFNGQNPDSRFRPPFQLEDPSDCYGDVDPTSLPGLAADGFIRALELPFDRERLWTRLYWRPSDDRARVLVMKRDGQRRDLHYCTFVNNLKVIRDRSSLQLCRARRNGRYALWARLNFVFYERMVLFYSTFVAMKHQDRSPVPHAALLDHFELGGGAAAADAGAGEIEVFGGVVQHDALRHALRLFRDPGSGVVRLEACALRGPMQDVPLWTAFVTRYARDPDWAQHEGGGVVSLVALRPPPSVFLAGYRLPRNRAGEYVLRFTTVIDARHFIESWNGLCRAN